MFVVHVVATGWRVPWVGGGTEPCPWGAYTLVGASEEALAMAQAGHDEGFH